MASIRLFDAHLHIIDEAFPLVPNQGYLPDPFSCDDYLRRMSEVDLCGGVVVSGSFQAFDQTYLLAALERLGPNFVGVTQLPADVSDEQLLTLNKAGVRGLRFNLQRGGSERLRHLTTMAARIHELVGWHVELYVDACELAELSSILLALPALSVDHMGLSKEGLPVLLALAEQGVRVKVTGFGRVNFDVRSALRDLHNANPEALMFGSDLPSTRAPRAYRDSDVELVSQVLGADAAEDVFYRNALEFYRLPVVADA